MPIASRDFSARRKYSPRSTIRTSRRSTASSSTPGAAPSCSNWSTARRWQTASHRGRIPIEDALPIARQIAEALEAAHEHGIVHRDLKPANIKLTQDGAVKVLDFGLAKALGQAEAGHYSGSVHLQADLSASPTVTSPAMATNAGIILGTAVYMSPEQAKGKPADKRSDIWAFGCVLYEMLTGKRAFDGEDLTDVVAAVVRGEPDWAALPADVPAHVRTLLKGCLEKDRKARIGDIAVARFLLEQGSTLPTAGVAATTQKPSHSRASIIWIGAAVVVALAAVALTLMVWRPWRASPTPAAPLRLTAELGADISLLTQASGSVTLSPDGTRIAFVGAPAAGTNPSLYVRRLDQLQATHLAGTEGGFSPFFSPDGEWIGYFGQGKLRKVAATGSASVTLCDAPNGRGASWSEDGWIYFTRDATLNRGDQARACRRWHARGCCEGRRQGRLTSLGAGVAGREGVVVYRARRRPAASIRPTSSRFR